MREDQRKCSKCGRSPESDPNIKVFRFPKPGITNSFRCESWAKYCFPDKMWHMKEFQEKLYTEHRMLCSRHFKECFFSDWPDSKKKLHKYAVPDVNTDEDKDAPPRTIQESRIEQTSAPTQVKGELKDDDRGNQEIDIAEDENCLEEDSHTQGDDLEIEQPFSWLKRDVIECDTEKDVPELDGDVKTEELSLYDPSEPVPQKDSGLKGASGPSLGHSGLFSCNVCHETIGGPFRYSCVQCGDFDLCRACEANDHHADHFVLRVPAIKPEGEVRSLLRSIRQVLASAIAPSDDAIDLLKDEVKQEEEEEIEDVEQEIEQDVELELSGDPLEEQQHPQQDVKYQDVEYLDVEFLEDCNEEESQRKVPLRKRWASSQEAPSPKRLTISHEARRLMQRLGMSERAPIPKSVETSQEAPSAKILATTAGKAPTIKKLAMSQEAPIVIRLATSGEEPGAKRLAMSQEAPSAKILATTAGKAPIIKKLAMSQEAPIVIRLATSGEEPGAKRLAMSQEAPSAKILATTAGKAPITKKVAMFQGAPGVKILATSEELGPKRLAMTLKEPSPLARSPKFHQTLTYEKTLKPNLKTAKPTSNPDRPAPIDQTLYRVASKDCYVSVRKFPTSEDSLSKRLAPSNKFGLSSRRVEPVSSIAKVAPTLDPETDTALSDDDRPTTDEGTLSPQISRVSPSNKEIDAIETPKQSYKMRVVSSTYLKGKVTDSSDES